jgi:pteridine reductase
MCDIHASERPRKNFAAYSMSKAALEQMVRVLALELAPKVRVNGVAPGVVAFPDSGAESDPEMQARYLKRVPLARSGTPEEAAEAVRWLALDATYTTGEVVRVDGGRWLG